MRMEMHLRYMMTLLRMEEHPSMRTRQHTRRQRTIQARPLKDILIDGRHRLTTPVSAMSSCIFHLVDQYIRSCGLYAMFLCAHFLRCWVVMFGNFFIQVLFPSTPLGQVLDLLCLIQHQPSWAGSTSRSRSSERKEKRKKHSKTSKREKKGFLSFGRLGVLLCCRFRLMLVAEPQFDLLCLDSLRSGHDLLSLQIKYWLDTFIWRIDS